MEMYKGHDLPLWPYVLPCSHCIVIYRGSSSLSSSFPSCFQAYFIFSGLSTSVLKTMASMDLDKVNLELIEALLEWIVSGKHSYPPGRQGNCGQFYWFTQLDRLCQYGHFKQTNLLNPALLLFQKKPTFDIYLHLTCLCVCLLLAQYHLS